MSDLSFEIITLYQKENKFLILYLRYGSRGIASLYLRGMIWFSVVQNHVVHVV